MRVISAYVSLRINTCESSHPAARERERRCQNLVHGQEAHTCTGANSELSKPDEVSNSFVKITSTSELGDELGISSHLWFRA